MAEIKRGGGGGDGEGERRERGKGCMCHSPYHSRSHMLP